MADTGIGTTITFGTTAWTPQVTNIAWDGISRESLKTSHLGTTTKHTYIPHDIPEPGGVSMTVHYDPSDPPDYDAAAETITITYPDASTHAFSGFIDDFKPGQADMDNLMTAEVHLKISGDVTFN